MAYSPIMRADPLQFLSDELESLKQQGLYRQLRVLESEQGAHATFDHRSVVNLSSNNYLGLTTHPKLRAGGARRGRAVSAPARDRCARSPARWTCTWSSSAGSPRSRTSKRSSSSRAALPPTPAPSPPILTKDDVDHLRRAESREHHRRLPLEPRRDQSVPAQGRRRGARHPEGAAGRPAQAAHHRRRVLDGRRPRAAARAVRRSPRSSAPS